MAIVILSLYQHRLKQRIGIRSKNQKKYDGFKIFNGKRVLFHTSDNERTGGLTQSSQHFVKSVKSTNGGGTPSHCVRN